MQTKLIICLMLMLSFSLVSATWAEKPAVFDIPRLDNITIDGDGGEWGNRGFRAAAMVPSEGSRQPATEFRVGWDESGLLLLDKVLDEALSEEAEPNVLWQGDSVELYLSPKYAAPESMQVIIAPGVDAHYPKPRFQFQGNPNNKERLSAMKVEAAAKKIAGGYLLEVRIPWSNIGVIPRPGVELPFQICTNDRDNQGEWGQVRWYPAQANILYLSESAYLLRLSHQASPALLARATGAYEQARSARISVTAAPEYIGKRYLLKEGRTSLANGTLTAGGGWAVGEIKLPMPLRGREHGELTLLMPEAAPIAVSLPTAAAARANEFINAKVVFSPYYFSEAKLPSGEFESPLAVESLIGHYTTTSSYYNAAFQPVDEAKEPGRYGAVLEVKPESGRMSRRFRTLYRTANATGDKPLVIANPATLAQMGINPTAIKVEAEGIDNFNSNLMESNQKYGDSAVLLAGLYDSGNDATKRDFSSNFRAQDRQWWVTFKRKYYGMDKIYPQPFVSPRKLAGAPAPVVHKGSLAEAGFKADAAQKIDAVCQEWAADSDEAFGVCVVRHGVIVLHKAYGTREGQPMTLTTQSWMASISKLMAASLMMQMVDQGFVNLDDPVDKFLPALRGIKVETPLTVRHLYTHTCGLDGHWGDGNNDLEELIADLYPTLEIGKHHNYNGVGYALGSKIVETISNEALPQFYKKHLLDPLGMNNTMVTTASWDARSVPMDMAVFGQMLLNGGAYGDQLFFSKATFQQMLPEKLTKVLGPNASLEWGIGITNMDWLSNEAVSAKTFGHGAASSATMAIDPVNDLIIVMTRNSEGKNFGAYNSRFFHAIGEGMVDFKR